MERLIVTNQEQRELQKARHDHQRIADVARQPKEHFQSDSCGERCMPDARIEFDAYLHDALGPTALLRFEGIDLHRNFRGCFFIQQVDKFPAHQLRAKTQVRVFSQSIVLPAAAHIDRVAPPDTSSTVEVEETTGAIACGLLDYEVAVEHDRLQASQKIVFTVDMRPAHLRTTDQRIGEEVD